MENGRATCAGESKNQPVAALARRKAGTDHPSAVARPRAREYQKVSESDGLLAGTGARRVSIGSLTPPNDRLTAPLAIPDNDLWLTKS